MPNRYVESCTYPGCFAATREGKPYCIEHIMQHDYPRKIQEMIAEREAEVRRIAQAPPDEQPVDVRGYAAQEVLGFLRDVGSATVERIARERGYSHAVSARIVSALAAAGLVEEKTTARGSVFAKYVEL